MLCSSFSTGLVPTSHLSLTALDHTSCTAKLIWRWSWLCLELHWLFDIHRIKTRYLIPNPSWSAPDFVSKTIPFQSTACHLSSCCTELYLTLIFIRHTSNALLFTNAVPSGSCVWFPFVSGKLLLILQSQAGVTCVKSFLSLQAGLAMFFFIFPPQLIHIFITELLRWYRSYFSTALLLPAIHWIF